MAHMDPNMSSAHWMGFPTTHLVDYPHHAVRPPPSRYSTLTGALEPLARPTYRSSRGAYDANLRAPSAYPYPTISSGTHRVSRNAVSSNALGRTYTLHGSGSRPTRTRARSQLHSRRPSIPQAASPPTSIPVNVPRPPSNYVKVPQVRYVHNPPMRDVMLSMIAFQRVGNSDLGLSVGDMVQSTYNPPIVAALDPVLARSTDIQVRIDILWPGYGSYPFEKRWSTQNGTLSREMLLLLTAQSISLFADRIRKDRVQVEPGYERWAIHKRPDGSRGIQAAGIIITALKHRGGCNWQPELYIPS